MLVKQYYSVSSNVFYPAIKYTINDESLVSNLYAFPFGQNNFLLN